MTSDPLVVTLALGGDDERYLDTLRRRYFPPERNRLSAHVTMFHQLPGDALDIVLDHVRAACRGPEFDVRVDGVRSLGRGAAFTLDSPELLGVRASLAADLAPWLTRQDAQRYAPHVTVANFLSPRDAKLLVGQLNAWFTPWTIRAEGVTVHRYLGGPWEQVAGERFRSS
ncbi:MAG: 2'-5' RNA ligase family protein [Janthinobacterium lividum]